MQKKTQKFFCRFLGFPLQHRRFYALLTLALTVFHFLHTWGLDDDTKTDKEDREEEKTETESEEEEEEAEVFSDDLPPTETSYSENVVEELGQVKCIQIEGKSSKWLNAHFLCRLGNGTNWWIYALSLSCNWLLVHSFICSFRLFLLRLFKSTSPLLLRRAPDTARILCQSFTPKHHK